MYKALLLFARLSKDTKQANPEDLIKLLNRHSKHIRYDYAYYEDLIHGINIGDASIYHCNTGKDIKDYDLVYHRRWGDAPDEALSCYLYLKKYGVVQVDTELDRRGSTNKLTQHWRLWENNLPFPRSIYVSKDCDNKNAQLIKLSKTLVYPRIVKSTSGTRGSDNYLVKNESELLDVFSNNPDTNFLIQEFIKNNGDYRVFVCGDEMKLLIHRKSSDGDYRNNVSLGGVAKLKNVESLDKAIIDDCIKAARVFHRDIAGVDVVLDLDNQGKYYIFEVNRAPQVEGSSYEPEKIRAVDDYFRQLVEDSSND